jgi:hypothetical protein
MASSEALYRMSPDWAEMRELNGAGFLADTPAPIKDWRSIYLAPEDQADIDAVIAEAIRTKSLFALEHRVLRADGSLGWALSRAVPVLDDAGEIAEWFGAANDITTRRESQEDNVRLLEDERSERERETILRELAELAASSVGRQGALDGLMRALQRLLGTRAAYVWIVDDRGQALLPAGSAGVDPRQLDEIYGPVDVSGDSGTASVYRAGQARFFSHLEDSATPAPVKLVGRTVGYRSGAGLPLVVGDKALGVLSLVWAEPRPFSDADTAFLRAVASEVALGVQVVRLYEHQRRAATTLQEYFLHSLPEISGWEFGRAFQPSSVHELVGGDFSDVFPASDGYFISLIGDVEGKGVEAAGLTETVRSAARALSLSAWSPNYVLAKLNDFLLSENRPLVTALHVALDARNGTYSLGSAGHPAPLKLTRDGLAREVSVTFGLPLGAFGSAAFRTAQGVIEYGESLVLYTDGITDARFEGDFFGRSGALAALAGQQGQSAQQIADGLRDAVVSYADDVRDDLQVLVVRRLPGRKP